MNKMLGRDYFPEKMSPHEKAYLIHMIEQIPTTTVCPDCVHFQMGFCSKWKDAIPADHLDKGCEEWKFNPNSPPF